MSTTFAEAREIVRAREADSWTLGTYDVEPEGDDLGDEWLVVRGAREFYVDGNADYIPMDLPPALVSKASGRLRYGAPLDHFDYSRPVSA